MLSHGAATPPDTTSRPAYRRFVEQVLRGDVAMPAASQIAARLRSARPDLFGQNHDATSARYLAEALARTIGTGVLTALALSHRLYLAVVLLWLVQAVNYFGLASVVHDAVHGSFFSSRALNRAVGLALGPLLLVRFHTFRRAHQLHHKFNQTNHDPKNRPVLSKSSTALGAIALWIHRNLYRPAPRPVQKVVVWSYMVLFAPPMLLLNHEFGALHSLRTREARLDAVLHVAYWGGLVAAFGFVPTLVVLLAPLPLAYVLLASVFFTHIHERSVSPKEYRRDDYELLIFNINNLTMGPVIDRLSFYFARYHVEHHLFPGIPFHRLGAVSEFVQREYGAYLLPTKRYDFDFLKTGMIDTSFDATEWEIGGRRYRCVRSLVVAT